MIAEQKSFDAGMNLILPASQIPPNGYQWLVNGRTRFGNIEPIKSHEELVNAPAGKKQGIIGVGDVLIAFIAGKAYYNIDGSSSWIQIPGLLMDTIVERYFTQTVPASTFNFVRKLDQSANNQVTVTTDFNVSGTPAGIVVQDTVNQPWVIFYDSANGIFTSRETKKYADWQNTSSIANDREYVPIGRQMMYLNEKLFIVSRDSKRIYHAVTGRPLDFMVNVDSDGNKLPSELSGGAISTSFAFDFDDITCLSECNIPDSFFYGTARRLRILTLDYTNTIFGEPRIRRSAIIESGVVSQDCIAELLGDYAIIDFENIKKFNAVLQLRNEGRNDIFSLQLASILKDVKQVSPICTVHDNYALFNLKTRWGNLIAVYDLLREIWTAFDITEVSQIKQFAFTTTTSATKLYCITSDNKLFRLYSSDTKSEQTTLATRAFSPDDTATEHKGAMLRPQFTEGDNANGIVYVTEYVNKQKSQGPTNQKLEQVTQGVNYPVMPPVIPANKSGIQNANFVLNKGLGGRDIYYVIQWTNKAKLQELRVSTTDLNKNTSLKQSAKIADGTA